MLANGIVRLILLAFVISGLTGCVNVDVNNYRGKANPTGGRIACSGSCGSGIQ